MVNKLSAKSRSPSKKPVSRSRSISERPVTAPVWRNALPSPEERNQLRRSTILLEAARSFNKAGFHGTTMDDIANSLGVTKAALYRYVPNKHTLLFECCNMALDSAIANIDRGEAEGANGLEKLRIAFRGYLEDLIGTLGHPTVLIEENSLLPQQLRAIIRRRDKVEKRYRNLIATGIADGSIHPCDPKLAVFALLGAVNWVTKWYRSDGEWSATELATSLVDMISRNLATNNL